MQAIKKKVGKPKKVGNQKKRKEKKQEIKKKSRNSNNVAKKKKIGYWKMYKKIRISRKLEKVGSQKNVVNEKIQEI